jgi:hypothetical protein
MRITWPAGWRHLSQTVLPSILISGVGPAVIYVLLRPHMSEFHALFAALLLPLAEGAITLCLRRRLNVFGAIVAASLGLAIITAFMSGSPRMLLARESLLSGAFGAFLLFSLVWSQPLVYHIAAHFVAGHDAARLLEFRLKARGRRIQRFFRGLTAVWGLLTLGDGLLNTYLAFHMAIPTYLVVTPLARYSVMGIALVWTLIHAQRGRYIAHLLPQAVAV